MAPVYRCIKDHYETFVCVTAQHREMLDQVMEFFEVPAHRDLDIMSHNQTLTQVTTRVLDGVSASIQDIRPDLVFVHGDTTTAFVSALAAFYAHIPVGHVEAGLRTRRMDEPFPEEMNRRQIGSLASLHFAPTARSRENLLAEAVPSESITVTGNTAIDALKLALRMPAVEQAPRMFRDGSRGVLVTAHRRENFGPGMENICRALLALKEAHADLHVVFPVHYNPNVRNTVERLLAGQDRITLIDPVDYAQFVRLMNDCHLVITDSGGVQEEAPSLGKPVLVLRDCTERPEAVTAGTVRIVGTNTEAILKEAGRLLGDAKEYALMARAVNPYGDGRASQRILWHLDRIFGTETPGAVPAEFDPETMTGTHG